MIKKILCKSLAVAGATLIATSVCAQGNAPLRILELNPDARSQALGGTNLVTHSNNYLYTNPTNIFGVESRFSAYVGTEFMPKQEIGGREKYVVASAGYKLNEHHAIFGGFRYLSGLSIPKVNGMGEDLATNIKPNQTILDLGYAYNSCDKFFAYATAAMIRSVSNKQTTNYIFGVGVSYKDEAALFDGTLPTRWTATLSAHHFGQDLNYGEGVSYRMPSTISLGVGAMSDINEDHSVGLQLQGGYVTSYKESQIGVGASYEYRKMIGVHTGFQHQGKGLDFYSLGTSLTFGKVSVNLTYRLGLSEFTRNSLAVGASIAL